MNKKTVLLFVSFMCVYGKYFVTAQNETTNVSDKLQHQQNNNFYLIQQKINTDVSRGNEVIHKNLTLASTTQIRRKKIRKRKMKRNKIKKNIVQKVTEASLTETTTLFQSSTLKVTKRRSRKKRIHKRKNNKNNILETATATPVGNKSFYFQTDKTFSDASKNAIINNKSEKLTTSVLQANASTTLTEKLINTANSTAVAKKKNRCGNNNGGCSQICKPKGKTKCSCIRGYKLAKNHKKCIDVNECRIKNGGCKKICRNTLGAYYCDCPLGFRLSDDLKSCQDINECHLRNGHGPCQGNCTNTYGSYICSCSHLNTTRLGKDKHSCEDINECEEMNPGCSHLCINTRMGGFCSCPEGMELMSDYKTCQDIDECEDTSVRLSCTRGCVNTIGSYYCEEDFQNDQNLNKTKVPACPPLNLPQHGFITCFRNNSLPYETFTKNGRRVIKNSPGTKCQLECPVGFKLLGEGRFVCEVSGKWTLKKKGLCIRSPHPRLQCPPDQTVSLKGRRAALIHFPPPQTNIRWKIVKSYPTWAKNLKGKLGEGQHSIQFSVTDPASKLSSTCSFSVVVKK